jgi:hypothetical protein
MCGLGIGNLCKVVSMVWGQLIVVSAVVVFTEASSLTPPVLPLVVRNPYLSVWLGNARGAPWEQWPMFYTGEQVSYDATRYCDSDSDWQL